MPTKKKHYLYHRVPDNMDGDVLYPLNRLKETNPAIYRKQAEKYEGRLHIMEQIIHPFGVLWNDVLHLTLIHRQEVHNALKSAGHDPKKVDMYEIDPATLDSTKLTIYVPSQRKHPSGIHPKDFLPFSEEEAAKHVHLPKRTLEYYREEARRGAHPLPYAYAPHVFYHGSIPIKGKKIIRLK